MSSIHQFRKIVYSSCGVCGKTIVGLKVKKFCSNSCKMKKYRANKAKK